MTLALKHRFTSQVADSQTNGIIKPSHWNDGHDLLLDAGRLLGRASNHPGAAEEIAPESGQLELALEGGTPKLKLANTTVIPGTYYNSQVTVDAKGRITEIHTGSTTGGSAPIANDYLLGVADPLVPNGRAVTNTPTIEWDISVANQAKASVVDDAISDAKLRNSAAVSVIGRSANSPGDPADIAASNNDTLLARVANALMFTQLTAGMVPDNLIGDSKLRDSAALSVIGRAANSAGDPADIPAAANDRLLSRVSDALAFTQLTAGMVPNDLITDAMLRNSAALSIVGRAANSSGDPADIAASTNDRVLARISDALSFSQLTAGMFPNDVINDAMLRNSAALSVIGRAGNSSGDPADISASSNDTLLRRVSNALDFGQLTLGMFPDDVVTYAKIQNVSATSRILGRKTSGAGDTEECTLSEVLDFIGSAAQGDVLYRGSSSWARLGAGTSGQFLKTNGAGLNPQWADPTGGGIALLNSGTVSSAATLDIVLTGYTAYRALKLVLMNFVPATDATDLYLRTSTDGGSNYDAGAGNYAWGNLTHFSSTLGGSGNTSDTKIVLNRNDTVSQHVSNVAGEGGWSGVIELLNQTATGNNFAISYVGHYYSDGVGAAGTYGHGWRLTAADIDAVRLLFSSGNIASGKWALYGYT